ncbi:hypothetical protein AMTRI_Chr10g6030 [Amborella trichopoda]|uniref:Uncharacterized protein n=1 Tax=Amborella trichopoda TaxID=13333 RepID=W1NXX5_AMBTC|nr:cyclin-D1-1 [Amborella trichopoda]ERM99544.1 hypothetical protein AMTR_s00088p00097010 [Amborella trichopoda]|eukprot:XP_006836691.1 cyclin-D1-1 [Amborella trichopoda]
MSLSSDCLSDDLLCSEDASFVGICDRDFSPEIDFPADSVAGFLEYESDFIPPNDYSERFRDGSIDLSARKDAIAWILRVHTYYQFRPLTAYLAVNYVDRFLSSHALPQGKGWPFQLLSVACLSLAAKMEEPTVPTLLDLQVGGARFIFEGRTVRRMEVLVLSKLGWRMRSVTPFTFIHHFLQNFFNSTSPFLLSRATQLVLGTIHGTEFMDFRPSSIAAAAALCAGDDLPEFPSLKKAKPGIFSIDGLCRESTLSCYQLMREILIRRPKPMKTPAPLFRVSPRSPIGVLDRHELPLSSSSYSSSTSNKRRKLNELCDAIANGPAQEREI